MNKIIEKIKTDRKTQIIIGVVVLLIVGGIIVAKLTARKGQDSNGAKSDENKGKKYG